MRLSFVSTCMNVKEHMGATVVQFIMQWPQECRKMESGDPAKA